jgi:thiamine-monophosphate kinase
MTCSEFDLIRRFFTEQPMQRADVPLGIGDDAALLAPPAGQQLAVSVDTLIAGVHFPLDTSARAVGHKSLAVNLSDLAAMGAEPAWATLALSVPEANTQWLSEFAQGFFDLARAHSVQLVGGDTTRGPLSITVQVMGFVTQGRALTRSGAQPGDGIFVSGNIGDAGLGLRLLQQADTASDAAASLIQQLEYPTPRIAAGIVLRGRATSAIDVSDGLVADLGHVLAASGVGADVQIEKLPLSTAYQALASANDWQAAVSAGDDYELCFTLPASQDVAALTELDCACTRIGEITAGPGLRWRDSEGRIQNVERTGFDHFSAGKQDE